MICRNCDGEQRVCENHRDRPWNATGCECGAGAPCPVCRADLANSHILHLLERAMGVIDGMERDCPSLIDWDARGPTLSEEIEAAVKHARDEAAFNVEKRG